MFGFAQVAVAICSQVYPRQYTSSSQQTVAPVVPSKRRQGITMTVRNERNLRYIGMGVAMDQLNMPTRYQSLAFVAALAAGAAVNLFVGAGTAHADPVVVQPGLTCDDFGGVVRCDNTTNSDYTVTQTRECSGGSWGESVPQTQYGPNGTSQTTYMWQTHSVEPHTQYASVFAPANNAGFGSNSCGRGSDPVRITYSIAPPPPS
jgi:hypothetical protein